MKVQIQGSHLTTLHVWFEKSIPLKVTTDMVTLHGYLGAVDACTNVVKKELQHTLITDLTVAEDEIVQSFTRTFRYQVNRAQREEILTHVFTSEQLSKDDAVIKSFSEMYRLMFEEKGRKNASINTRELEAYIKSNSLIITCTYLKDNPVVYHSYVCDGKHARLLHSCSEFRAAENATRNAIGRANKYLHVQDMRYFISLGYEEYDWGGVFSYDGDDGIDKFKMSFGGTHRDYYNITYCVSSKAKMLYRIYELVKRL